MQLPPELEAIGQRVRVLRDRVLIRPLAYEHPVLATVGVDVQKGIVIAVGYGRRQRRKTAFHQKMSGYGDGRTQYFEDGEETGKILPMKVKPGDVVEFSFRNYEIVNFDSIFDGKFTTKTISVGGFRTTVTAGKREAAFPGIGDLVFVWQNAIMTIDTEESLHESLLWQQSAGYDRNGNFMSGAESWDRG